MPILKEIAPTVIIDVLKKFDLLVTNADVEIRRLQSGGISVKINSAKLSLMTKPKER
jgi:hypothetical protein